MINNENAVIEEYTNGLKMLKKLVLVKYADDIGVVPNESTWFGYTNGNKDVIKLEDMDIYQQDKLGLKAMKENGQLIFLTSPLGHLRLDETWFSVIIIPLLKEHCE